MSADTVGGVWTYSLDLARGLGKRGVHVFLATMGGWLSNDQRREAAGLENVEIFESRFRLEWMDSPWEDVRRAGDWLRTLEMRLRPDIVHLNGYAHGAWQWEAPVVMAGHSCVLSWWEAVKREAAPAEWNRYREEARTGLQSASLVVAPTSAMLEALERHYGPFRASLTIPNGREAGRFAPVVKEPFLFAAGRLWDEAKNIALLDAVARGLPWPAYIAGDVRNPNGSCFRQANARLLGRLSAGQMANWYARASIYALPARYEPFGLSIVEAGLSGCALALGDIPSLRENWEGAALFADPGDSAALREALLSLIGDVELRAQMAARARARAAAFTPERMAESYLSAYRSVMIEDEVRSCA